ncbi:MAG TPA: VOC family protein [Xanthobacteraceae bacterium]|nr:VOC family protein [Xanthobacteraceae bacterium]
MAAVRLQNVYVRASDIAASRHFYEALLGLAPKFVDGERWVQYDAGGTSFALGCPGEYPETATGAIAVFEVPDLDARKAQMERAGIRVVASRDMGSHGRVLTVLDPAGNHLQLFQRARPAG